MRDMPDPKMKPDQVAVKMIRVGLCGTDAEINHGPLRQAARGDEFLILGHENLGVVEEVGKKVKGWKAGRPRRRDRRRPCGKCPQCKAGENDMCSSGQYTERGIMRRHGYMAQYYVESPTFMNKIPKEIRDFAVLLEPMSVVQKGIDHTYLLQQRLKGWKPKFAMVLGAGPIGLLAAAVLRVRGLRTRSSAAKTRATSRASSSSSSAPSTSASPTRRCPTCRRKPAIPTSSSRRPACRASSSTRWRSSGPTACCACCR
jgi:threonine dehydrogenase-like Zn-dependent dehydrogenase